MTEIKYETVVDHLITSIPELREKYEKELEWWGTERPGPHIIYGDLLTPHLIAAIERNDGAEIRRVFDSLEILAAHPDPKVQEIAAFSVCERLTDNSDWMKTARSYMGPAMTAVCSQTEESMRRKK